PFEPLIQEAIVGREDPNLETLESVNAADFQERIRLALLKNSKAFVASPAAIKLLRKAFANVEDLDLRPFSKLGTKTIQAVLEDPVATTSLVKVDLTGCAIGLETLEAILVKIPTLHELCYMDLSYRNALATLRSPGRLATLEIDASALYGLAFSTDPYTWQ
ncbi:hypothetical protein MMC25_000211, partial [Agyrium rufum]|nr:hypothetical protein [Agyrium rufum]